MKYPAIFILTTLLLACNSNKQPEIESDDMYYILREENNSYNKLLSENISHLIQKRKITDPTTIGIAQYDSLTKQHIEYLNELQTKLDKTKQNIFFDGVILTTVGENYLNRTKIYTSQINELVNSKEIRAKIDLLISPRDIEHKSEDGKVQIKHMDYFFSNLKSAGIITYLSSKKRNLLEIENEFLKEAISKNQ